MPRTLKIITIWLLLGTFVFLVALWFEYSKNKTSFTVSDRVIEIRRDSDGHYYWQGNVQGQAVNFLIDTGATTTSIPKQIATQAGLTLGPTVQVMTANGVTRVATATVNLELEGDIFIQNLPVTVSASNAAQALLGMNVISKFNWSQEDGIMRIQR